MAASLSGCFAPAALIIKPAGDSCNLRCAYCFYRAHPQPCPPMNPELLETIIREYLGLRRPVARFIWHGGEPLLAGLGSFERIIAWQREFAQPDQVIMNQLQTNGVLIDEGWARFFQRSGFGIGISLDGCQASHDRHRTSAAGRGSHGDAVRGLQLLHAHGVRTGVIQVVSRSTLADCAADFQFFADALKLNRWAVNQFYAPGHPEHVGPAEWTAYLKELAELWLIHGRREIRVRELTNLLAGVVDKRPRLCQFNGDCVRYLCIEADGRVYPCDRFSGQAEFLLGDLRVQPLAAVLAGEPRRRWQERASHRPARCQRCEYAQVCHNGCAQHRSGGPDGRYDYCESRLALYAFLREAIAQHQARQAGEVADGC
jgi:uncharacterized protein